MNAVTLINRLAEQDIRLWLDDGRLRYSAPDGAMTDEVIAELRENKEALVQFLSQSARNQDVIQPVDHTVAQPASFAQQRLWFVHQLDPGNNAYHIHATLRIKGRPDTALLEKACRKIIQRHAILRSRYEQKAGKLVQIIEPDVDWQLATTDSDEDTACQAIARQLHQPFDLSYTPPLRCTLFRLADDDYLFSFTVHHIAADGWSLGLFIRELVMLYKAYSQQQPSPLPDLPLQYVDYAVWQNSENHQQRLQQQLHYWQQQLAGTPNLELPLKAARSLNTPADAAIIEQHLDKTLSGQLLDSCQKNDVTLFMLMMALFSTLLHRYSRQTDFCIGTPIAGRSSSRLESMIGCFLNVLAIRCEPASESTFSEYLQTIKTRSSEAFANQDVPFEQVVQALDLPRDPSLTPLFQVMLSIQNTPSVEDKLPGLDISPYQATTPAAQFDLKLTVQEQENGIALAFEYKTALFEADTIAAMNKHLTALCRSVCQTPDAPLHKLNLFGSQPLDEILGLRPGGFNDTAATLPDNLLLHQLFAEQADKTPDALAVSDEKQALTYRVLDEQSSQLANWLIAQGHQPGELIGVCLYRSIHMSVALLGILKTGCAWVPFDPDFPTERLRFMAEDTHTPLLICDAQSRAVAESVSEHILCMADMPHKAMDKSRPAITVADDALFNVIYTSGSTGTPKGVMVPHRGIANRLLWMQKHYPLAAHNTVLQKTPYSFDVSVWELFWPLICGSHYHFAEPDSHKDPARLRDLIIEKNIHTLHFVPSMLGSFLATAGVEQCQSLRQVFCSGEALQNQHVQDFYRRLSQARLHNLYGPTEAAIDVSWHDCKAHEQQPSVPIGRPIANTQLHVLDEHLNPVPDGIAGELYIGGVNLARGYLNREQLTADTFINNPFARNSHPSPRLYKTGDLVRMNRQGELLYLGRLDHQVKLRGLRIELGEIEAALQSDSRIRDVVVCAWQNGGDAHLAAYYLADEAIASDHLRQHLARRLPTYMVPAAFIHMPEWPLSPNGKISRNRLPRPDWNTINRKPYVAPQSDTEKQLVAIWQGVLGVEKIGIHDNFFELGGHSLSATQALAEARQQFAVELPLRQIFENPTIAAIAALIDEALLEQQVFAEDEADNDDSESFIL